MAKKVTIILGAGASCDLIHTSLKNYVKNHEYKPPLTSNLFDAQWIAGILGNYPRAQTAVAWLKTKLQGNSQTLEGLLKTLKESGEESKEQQFRQIPVFLQQFFSEIHNNYCYHPVNYSLLVSEAQRSSIQGVAYITLNYDLFLEEALSKERGIVFDNTSKYIPEKEKWAYLKLHGSINWGRRFSKVQNPGNTLAAFLENISVLDLEKDLGAEIEVDYSYKNRPRTDENYKYYPALSIPVEGGYKLNAPKEHLGRIKEFLKDCSNFLIIGVSGRDKDLLEILQESITDPKLVCLVGGENIEGTKGRFSEGVPQFRKAGWQIFQNGFSDFIVKNQLDGFLDSLTG